MTNKNGSFVGFGFTPYNPSACGRWEALGKGEDGEWKVKQKNGAELEFLVTLKSGEVGRTVDEARWAMGPDEKKELAEYLSGLE